MNMIIILHGKRFRMVLFSMLLLISLGMVDSIHAQKATKKNRLYKTWIKKTNSKTRMVGALYQVEDTKLAIANSFKLNDYNLNQFDYQDVYAHEIKKIKLRRKGKPGRGVLIGVVGGLVTGAIIGFVDGDDPPCVPPAGLGSGLLTLFGQILYDLCKDSRQTAAEKALGYGFSLGMLGGMVGAVVGSLKIKIPINGSTEKFKANKIRLKGYSYRGLYGSKP